MIRVRVTYLLAAVTGVCLVCAWTSPGIRAGGADASGQTFRSGSTSSQVSGANGGTLTIGTSSEPTSLDLGVAGGAIGDALLYNVYEGLVRQDPTTARIVPLLASRWTTSNSGRKYTFYLRRNVHFDDGHHLTSADVVWSFNRVIAPNSTNYYKQKMAVVSKVSAKGPYAVTVTLAHHSNEWLVAIAQQVGAVFEKGSTNLGARVNGTGPFIFKQWLHGKSITLVRNNHYWGRKAKVAKVVFSYITDANALNNAMLSGQLNVAYISAPQLLKVFKGKKQFIVTSGRTWGIFVLVFNNQASPTSNKLVRQAITYAIDRQALVNTVQAGYGTVTGTMISPSWSWFKNLKRDYPYDPGKAKQLLTQAGYPSGFSVNMDVPQDGLSTLAAPFIQAELANVGIKVTLNQVSLAQWLNTDFTQKQFVFTTITHNDPYVLDRFGQPSYYFGYNNPNVADWLAQADQTTSASQEATYYQKAAKQLSSDAAVDPLFAEPNLLVRRSNVKGYPKDQLLFSFDCTKVSLGR